MKKLMTIMVTVVMMMAMTVSVMAGESLTRKEFEDGLEMMRNEYEEERDLYEGFIKESSVEGKYIDENNFNVRINETIWNNIEYRCDMRCYDGNVSYVTYLNGTCLPMSYVNDYYWYELEKFENNR